MNTDLENILKPNARLYFVGIGGIAMSAVASIAKGLGFEVSGSDSKEVYSPAKDVLKKSKIVFFKGYKEEQVKASNADLFILSAGETLENPEVKYIYGQNLPHAGFAELLYHLAKEKLRVVVAGTHGKSTTTGLLGHLFKNLDDSSFMAGAVLQNYQSNFYLGDGNYFVFEGDEYKEEFDDPTPKFQYYHPDILVLTNLEYDHPDLFPNLQALEQEFRLLIEKMPEDGLIVYNADDATLVKLVNESNVSSVSFAIDNEADFKIDQIQYGAEHTTVEVINKFSKAVSSKLLGQTEQYKIQLPGKINVYNALAAIATLRSLGFAQEQIALDLLTYQGVKRRFELVGVKNGVTIIDDYAHHATAVRETLEAARLRYFRGDKGGKKEDDFGSPLTPLPSTLAPKLWAVFEPHTFSRTKATLPDLAKSFGSADEVLISEIYPAREKASEATITSQEVINAICSDAPRRAGHVRLVRDKDNAMNILKSEAKEGDVVIVMAVGSFNRLAYELKEIL
jgi:UDP-N-acetylmuramate:L-alanyl-gamma-D-glutamyl-meso-diaminopimelate ligase